LRSRRYDIRTPDIETPASSLSGGNLQKLIIGRELCTHPQIIVYNKPTQGLDLRTTLFVRRRLRELSQGDGMGAVIISTDLDELLELCDRIGVLFRGRLTGVVENAGSGIEQELGALMLGGAGEDT
jgi:simple sugar transport system ATP-binding protein